MRFYSANIHSKQATDALITSVTHYFDLFDYNKIPTAKNALNAMLYHFKDVLMTDFYLELFPKETFILRRDTLHISLKPEKHYVVDKNISDNHTGQLQDFQVLEFMRNFKFDDITDETIEIRLSLYFPFHKDTIKHPETHISLDKYSSTTDDWDLEISKINTHPWMQIHKNILIFDSKLYINYNV